MKSPRIIAAVAAGGLALAACGGGSSGSDATPEPAATEAPATAPATDAPTPVDTETASEPPATTGESASGAADPVDEPAADEPAADEQPVDEPTAVPPILEFSAPLVGGGEIDAAALAGTPTVFWFWAPT